MIDFMVIGLPRSGTAWLANLLTTDTSLCLHEALMNYSFEQLNSIDTFGKFGVAETSAIFHADKLRAHSAKKLIVERDLEEINKSLQKLELPEAPQEFVELLDKIEGYRIQFADIFNYDKMSKAYEYLIDKRLSYTRHKMLCDLNVQNQTAIIKVKEML